jgi:hypothetical protein
MIWVRYILLVFLSGFAVSLAGQSANGLTYPAEETYSNDTVPGYFFRPGNVSVDLSMGMSFTSAAGGGVFAGSYVSPFVSYDVSKRFRLKVGAGIFNNFGGFAYSPYDMYSPYALRPVNFSRVMVGGDYFLNEKVTFSGMVYKDFNPFVGSDQNSDLQLQDGEGFMFNLNYRPAENFEINIGIDYSRGHNPYYYSPFRQPSVFSPYPGLNRW